jgi:hypothetical protein
MVPGPSPPHSLVLVWGSKLVLACVLYMYPHSSDLIALETAATVTDGRVHLANAHLYRQPAGYNTRTSPFPLPT